MRTGLIMQLPETKKPQKRCKSLNTATKVISDINAHPRKTRLVKKNSAKNAGLSIELMSVNVQL